MNFGRALPSRSNRRRAVLPAVAAPVALLTLAACGGGATSGGGGDTNFVTNTGGMQTVASADREPVNKIAGETLDGKRLDVADLRGKVVVLNVWGSWCGPCRAEAPYFAKVAKETEAKGQDIVFVGLNARDANKGNAIAFEKDYGVTYPSIYDPAGRLIVNGFPKGSLNPQAIPSTIVLDRDGKIAARSLKALDDKKLRELIDPLIAEK
ncbi:TlpA family protein disulfide reductase [Streptomyces sp. NBC_01498]|uniref:TlpA family protein disulfide reductase n=1 Tax=Streptomyces sp. NBC_01498 TaxID=2975870 RepID=UPI002E7B5B18|nr:TlpA disulfide reductase family protein [Streptomyces sp. NBC_01498]WTL25282.1 TlpA family protein disulfide reductase [Streptomyces sp. NBC_01498]